MDKKNIYDDAVIYDNPGDYESTLYRVNQESWKNYDNAFKQQVEETGGRVDTHAVAFKSKALYDQEYRSITLDTIRRNKAITDTDPRATFRDKKGNISKRFFRSSDLYIIPQGKDGTGDKQYQSSISKNYTSYVRDNAGKGGPIRLPDLPHAQGIARNFGSDAAAGYIRCMTTNTPIKNGGLVPLASSPQNIQDNHSIEMASESVIGASQGYNLFSSTGTRVVSFTFDVYADYLPYPFNNVSEYCLALKQMNYPTYSGLKVNSPDVIFTYGGIRVRGIPQISCTYDTTTKRGIVDKASVSVQITETEEITNGIAKI